MIDFNDEGLSKSISRPFRVSIFLIVAAVLPLKTVLPPFDLQPSAGGGEMLSSSVKG